MKGRPRIHSLLGRDFGFLSVLEEAPRRGRSRNRWWKCICRVCGAEVRRRQDQLLGGQRSCGCQAGESHVKHGALRGRRSTTEYRAWLAMKTRCGNPKASNYKHYGGRGITAPTAWIKSFSSFLAAVGSAPSPKHRLERIDNKASYSKENVRWATHREQMRNTRRTVRLTFRGETKSVVDWAEVLGVPAARLYARVKAGWSTEKTLTKGVG